MKIETTASGKVFFSGEYMALEGGRVITLSLPQNAKVTISENNQSNNILFSSMSDHEYPFKIGKDMEVTWLEDDPKHIGSILKESINQFDKSFSSRSISIDTSEFFYQHQKIGIGSSSAVSVAITKALGQLFDLRLTPSEIINHSRAIHNKAQNSIGSGFDIITSFVEGRTLSCRTLHNGTHDYEQIELPESIKIIGVINHEYVQTSEMIDRYKAAKNQYTDYFSQNAPLMMSALEDLYNSILKKDNKSILRYLNKYNDLLVDMDKKFNIGIFNNHHELIKLAKDSDVFYKPSGSGGGDIGLLISDDKKKLDRVCQKLNLREVAFFEI